MWAVCGRLRTGKPGQLWLLSGELRWGFPPPAEMARALEIPRALAVFRDSRPWIWGPAATSTASVFCTLADAGANWASSALLQHIFIIFGGDEYMFGKKVFAAMLATVLGASLFGANAAKAVINLSADDKSSAVATYATETLTMAVTDSDGYYMAVGVGNALNVMGEVGLGGPENSIVTIRFDLRGLVFSTAVMDDDLTSDDHDDESIRTGGEVGSNFVSFLVSREMDATRASVVTLAIQNIGVKPGVAGSVTMTVRDTLGPEMITRTYSGAIRTAKALQETATPKNAEATVKHRFVSFDGSPTATLGSFMVGMVDPPLLNAAGGAPVALTPTADNADNHVIDPSMGTVTIEGDFSFASRVWCCKTNPPPTTGLRVTATWGINGRRTTK